MEGPSRDNVHSREETLRETFHRYQQGEKSCKLPTSQRVARGRWGRSAKQLIALYVVSGHRSLARGIFIFPPISCHFLPSHVFRSQSGPAMASECRGPADTNPIFVRIRVSPQDAIDIKGVGLRKVHKQYGRGLNYRIRGATRGVAQGNVPSLNVSLFHAGVDSGSRKCIIPADVEIGHTTS